MIGAIILGIGDTEAFDLAGLPGAVIGMILILFVYDQFSGRGGAAPAG